MIAQHPELWPLIVLLVILMIIGVSDLIYAGVCAAGRWAVQTKKKKTQEWTAVCSACRSRNVERDREQEHPGVGRCADCGHDYITDELRTQ